MLARGYLCAARHAVPLPRGPLARRRGFTGRGRIVMRPYTDKRRFDFMLRWPVELHEAVALAERQNSLAR